MAKNGLVLITKATFSGQSSVSIENCFSATYTHYIVKRNFSASAADLNVNVRLRVGGSDASGANYRYQVLEATSTTVSGARATGQSTFTAALGATELTAIGWAELWISNPFEAVPTTMWRDAGYTMTGNLGITPIVQAHDLSTSYTGITVYPSSGTITGSISVWGLVKS